MNWNLDAVTSDRKKENKAKKVYNCIIIDEHPIYRLGINYLFETDPEIHIIAGVDTVYEIVNTMLETEPDIAILNISIEGHNSLESIKVLKDKYPDIFILVISIYDEKFLAKRVIRAGAHGYIMKEAMASDVKVAVTDILNGKIYFSDFLRNFMLENFFDFNVDIEEHRIDQLNDKEFEVFILLGKGINLSQIAVKLNRTLSTIETYKRNIKKILNFRKTSKLKEFAVRWVKKHKIYK